MAMRRQPDGLPESTGKVVSAQARNRRQAIKGEIAFQICFNVIQHTAQSALIEPSSCGTYPDIKASLILTWQAAGRDPGQAGCK
jgi:hypothetical protein